MDSALNSVPNWEPDVGVKASWRGSKFPLMPAMRNASISEGSYDEPAAYTIRDEIETTIAKLRLVISEEASLRKALHALFVKRREDAEEKVKKANLHLYLVNDEESAFCQAVKEAAVTANKDLGGSVFTREAKADLVKRLTSGPSAHLFNPIGSPAVNGRTLLDDQLKSPPNIVYTLTPTRSPARSTRRFEPSPSPRPSICDIEPSIACKSPRRFVSDFGESHPSVATGPQIMQSPPMALPLGSLTYEYSSPFTKRSPNLRSVSQHPSTPAPVSASAAYETQSKLTLNDDIHAFGNLKHKEEKKLTPVLNLFHLTCNPEPDERSSLDYQRLQEEKERVEKELKLREAELAAFREQAREADRVAAERDEEDRLKVQQYEEVMRLKEERIAAEEKGRWGRECEEKVTKAEQALLEMLGGDSGKFVAGCVKEEKGKERASNEEPNEEGAEEKRRKAGRALLDIIGGETRKSSKGGKKKGSRAIANDAFTKPTLGGLSLIDGKPPGNQESPDAGDEEEEELMVDDDDFVAFLTKNKKGTALKTAGLKKAIKKKPNVLEMAIDPTGEPCQYIFAG